MRPGAGLLTSLRGLTLRIKLLIFVVLVALCSVVPLSVLHFFSAQEREYQIALKDLDAAAARYSERIHSAFLSMEQDAKFSTGLPPVQGIQRVIEAGTGYDPADGSSLEMWRTRLETIFTGLLQERPQYTQLRFIGRGDNWREIVRVNAGPDGPVVVAPPDLQQKGNEPYLSDMSESVPGESFFSEVSLNREHGLVEGPPVIRLVRPVFDSDGRVFGAIVINANFKSLLHFAAPVVAENVRATVVTGAFDYMTFDAVTKAPELVFRPDMVRQAGLPLELVNNVANFNRLIMTEDMAIYVHQVEEGGGTRPFSLYLITEIAKSDLFAEANQRLRDDFVVSVLLIVMSMAMALIVGTYLTRPLSALHQEIMSRQDATLPIKLTTQSKDEVGELATAFVDMSNDLLRETLRVRAIFSAVGNAMIVIDENGIIEEFNPAASTLFGYDQSEIVGRKVECLMPKDIAAKHHRYVSKFDSGSRQMGKDREIIGLRKNGDFVHLAISVNHVTYDGRKHVIGLARDISSRKRAQARVQELIGALERSNEELDQFAYVASHDLKAPLRVIENASRWLAEDLEEHLTEDTRESLELLQNRVARMERLLDDLLEHSRIGRTENDSDTVRGDLLLDGIRELLSIPEQFELRISREFTEIHVQRMPLQTVLLNLISNAIKHHDSDRGQIDVSVIDHGHEFEFIVQDDGPGIPLKYQKKVFELFQTLRPRDQIESSGMGLAMVRKHVEVVGGQIHLNSDGLRGTAFHLHWPKSARPNTTDIKHAS